MDFQNFQIFLKNHSGVTRGPPPKKKIGPDRFSRLDVYWINKDFGQIFNFEKYLWSENIHKIYEIIKKSGTLRHLWNPILPGTGFPWFHKPPPNLGLPLSMSLSKYIKRIYRVSPRNISIPILIQKILLISCFH